jgi:mono/diheme cytochrome c family protein
MRVLMAMSLALVISGCGEDAPASSGISAPAIDGRAVYVRCQACHGLDGAGVPGLYPPLRASAKLRADDPAAAIAVVLHGAPSARPGAPAMPACAHLSDDEIAAVLTWMRRSWVEPSAIAVMPEQVRRVRAP